MPLSTETPSLVVSPPIQVRFISIDGTSDDSSIEGDLRENDPAEILDPNPYFNDRFARSFRRCNDLLVGCTSIAGIVLRLRTITAEYENLQRQGWDLHVPVRDSFVHIIRNLPYPDPLSPD